MSNMEPPPRPASALFDVFLRLRPSSASNERFLDVEHIGDNVPTHITIRPTANDHRKRAIEKFAFTRVFEENASQLDMFKDTGMLSLIEGVLGTDKRASRDGLLATLGVTGSGKSHTILGTKSQRGITQMSLDVIFRNLSDRIALPSSTQTVFSLSAADVSESQLLPAYIYLDSIYGESHAESRMASRAQTPMMVGEESHTLLHSTSIGLYPAIQLSKPPCQTSLVSSSSPIMSKSYIPTANGVANIFHRFTRSIAKSGSSHVKDASSFIGPPRSRHMPQVTALPRTPSVDDISVRIDENAEYAIVISMYEVYNDRIYDLLTPSAATAKAGVGKRRPLLYKSTELSPDRKVVAGLRKIICGTLEEALMVLETGLIERRVAGTGSNAVSSRSHGFFSVEVKKRIPTKSTTWTSNGLTIVDLAGSERARNAKTAGATLAEAGKINESLMYLGQCMQMQSDNQDGNRQNLVPFRQCKLTELLFSNSFPSLSVQSQHHQHRNPQKAIMIVNADPIGDFNATSQILRYSALAREVTVPRIPSITSTILSGTTATARQMSSSSGRTSPAESDPDDDEHDHALQEIGRLNEEMEILELRFQEEAKRRLAAEASWRAAEERMVEVEQQVRAECYDEMEAKIDEERRRWKWAWEEEADRNDAHLDQKLSLLTQNVKIHEDAAPSVDERVRELENENDVLRRKLENLEREMQQRSPTKKQRVLKAKKFEVGVSILDSP
ncbi:P-loop containing nucleoside triphosphate hydrolase protein [Pseudovirgaria hyperparasitica]|uniref:P-loop containing nucleoside triphosphate hydrolase protein n=1 Tax=Pseudovirgaria hyperparasitica TaxID=470096 RepID=A0A6A6WGB1_9PEZI|nr:P-loop containing nucleoside triphosphate hydrolase protein [Pseudovirgaria hyperparasitica]KAF2761080.1 P-loop containing nucleoside triphosphate hydrolase protein [Pseudovirgaria hyperparasitica]